MIKAVGGSDVPDRAMIKAVGGNDVPDRAMIMTARRS